MLQDVHRKRNLRLLKQKQLTARSKTLFTIKLDWSLTKKPVTIR